MSGSEIAGTRVLVVEDEELIAMLLVDMLDQLGCVAVGPAATIAEADKLADARGFDAAVLDVHVDGRSIYDLADRLRQEGVPLVIASGSGADALPERLRDCVMLPKPYTITALEEALQRARLDRVR